ncbi:undecaprenyl-phosphate glucose phosphotransferase [Asticcacaulis sp. EMRT-3]|uniref:undecaprenyl-phosphate glucose phosphotransferase n=1 Tax=Asticcacaulis sp. EMRT-3 TaxID=3040349 RepID=UPI0024AF0EA1|nr:undecaprenyl-phosphate glucose phosphotransferase [Asticcacaulis sp. EMRT-3]MDI7774729.1 undecaprenyl-phosphate glucose phosphotransferase [Asticcacaulis sp. EMRT-3]
MNVAFNAPVNAATALSSDPEDRRGPFRPEKLVSARLRRSGGMSVRLFRSLDLIALLILTLIAAMPATHGHWLRAPLGDVLPFIAAAAALATGLNMFGLYRFGRNENPIHHLAKLAFALAIALIAGLLFALLPTGRAALMNGLTNWAAMTAAGFAALHLLWWSAVRRWRKQGRLTPNIVIVGATRHARKLIEAATLQRDVNILGIFDDRMARNPHSVAGVPVLGDVQSLLGHKITPFVDQIVVAIDTSAKARLKDIVEKLRSLPNQVALLVDVDNDYERNAALSRLSDLPLARISGISEDERKEMIKRAEDLVVGTLALLIFAPVMLAVAIAIKLDSPGPVFFRQRRHGFNNEAIRVWKFRSMHTHLTDHTAQQQVMKGDPRVTRIGRFIRKTSLDELPQLFNVLAGEMSLVGPRPHAIGMKTGPDESARLVAEYAWRHRMKPGMTGWAQINGSRGAMDLPEDVRRRIAFDVDYIERHSLWLDLWIMAMTIPCLLGDAKTVR